MSDFSGMTSLNPGYRALVLGASGGIGRAFAAAIKGSKEIAFAVVAMTLTLAAVYAPLAFTPGRTGRLFAEFALALAGAVVVSGFVALTLSPMMCSKLLRHNPKPSRFDRGMERVLNGITRGYSRVLAASLRVRWLVVAVMVGSAAGSWLLLQNTRQELAPIEDRGVILASINGPDGATLSYTRRYSDAIERLGAQLDGVRRELAQIETEEVGKPIRFARKDIEGGGIYVNNVKSPDISRALTIADLLFGKYLLLRKGKRTYAVLKVV